MVQTESLPSTRHFREKVWEERDCWCVKVSLQVLHPRRRKNAFPCSSSPILYTEVQRLANVESRSLWMHCDSWKTVFNSRPWRTHSQKWEGIKTSSLFLLFTPYNNCEGESLYQVVSLLSQEHSPLLFCFTRCTTMVIETKY